MRIIIVKHTGLLIFCGKKAKFRGIFRGKFAEKSADFAGKKSKFAEQSANFGRFSREKSQNSQKNQPISRDFSGIKSIFEGFLGKSADFRGNFGGKLHQETINISQPEALLS